MPTSVEELLAAAGLKPAGSVPWGHPVALSEPGGVYVVAAEEDPASTHGLGGSCPLSEDRIRELVDRRGEELCVDGVRATPGALADRLAACWLPDEPVLYIGMTTRPVSARVNDYYVTKLGKRSPHRGGYFLKLLSDLDELYVHFAEAGDPLLAEDLMLRRFCSGVSSEALAQLHDPVHPFPFANLEWEQRKRHGITGATERRRRAT